ncbi:hypothetical protein QH494_03750 [Sphingomonas sp. AR_OL41]|uniref:hypothetical protein n=1 Tax=Sphingomonas sp. AR_OL41 TaxID=3042729 RepID=UPI00247FCF38|nr:hypothetical protein [Sphingomonas sp. AR_OL41]MDH7971284.1 hypothetical protein [Sphingomonas sp. AR_OL41]
MEQIPGLDPFPDEPAFMKVGEATSFAVMGRGAPSARWVRMTLGVRSRSADEGYLISNAHEDKLETVERWCLMGPRRCALPLRGYRWRRDDLWIHTAPVWAPCIFEGGHFRPGAPDPDDLRTVMIAEAVTGGATPVLLDEATMLHWLSARQWEALDVIRGAGRVRHDQLALG